MKRLFFYLATIMSVSYGIMAEDFRGQFNELLTSGYLNEAAETLNRWIMTAPDDPELYPARFNYDFNRAYTRRLYEDSVPGSKGTIITFTDSLGHKYAMTAYGANVWDDSAFKKAIAEIERGIEAYPNRLDFRLGEATAYQQRCSNDAEPRFKTNLDVYYDSLANVIIELIDYDNSHHPEWLWTGGEPIAEDTSKVSELFREGYISHVLWLANEGGLKAASRVARRMLQIDSDDATAYNILASERAEEEDYPEAIKLFKETLRIAPDEPLVLNNLAVTYYKMGEKDKALEIYRQLCEDESIDGEIREFARKAYEEIANEICNGVEPIDANHSR